MNKNFIISCYQLLPNSYFLLRDQPWEEFGDGNLPNYLKDGYEIFYKQLQSFQKLQRPLTVLEEHELEFMLSSLIHAKNSLFPNSLDE